MRPLPRNTKIPYKKDQFNELQFEPNRAVLNFTDRGLKISQ